MLNICIVTVCFLEFVGVSRLNILRSEQKLFVVVLELRLFKSDLSN